MLPPSKFISDLRTMAGGEYAAASLARALANSAGYLGTPDALGAIAMSRACELKAVLLQLEAVLDENDPQLKRCRALLAVLG